MHSIQKKLLELAERHDLTTLGLRQIGRMIDVDHPQKVKYHLYRIGVLDTANQKVPRIKKHITVAKLQQGLIRLPILGLANCGDATMIADGTLEGHLPISLKLLHRKNTRDLFIVRAVGTSMNKASIKGKAINDGDYVVIDSADRIPSDGDYVLSVIGGNANIKLFRHDEENHVVILESQSTNYFPPIYLHEDDLIDYIVGGKVVQVIKQPCDDTSITFEKIAHA